MRIAILGASGATGRRLTVAALDRGHTVVAMVRSPERFDLSGLLGSDPAVSDPAISDRIIVTKADVRDAESIANAVAGTHAVVSGLGVARGDQPGALTAGARALIATSHPRIVWLGGFGTGASAERAGWLTRSILALALRSELPDKATAETELLSAGATVFHAGPLSNAPRSGGYRVVTLDDVPRRLVPASISRSTVAEAMLDEAEKATPRPGILVPLSTGPRRERS